MCMSGYSGFLRNLSPNTKFNIFAWFRTMWKKQILARAIYQNPKRKLRVTRPFPEIIELKFVIHSFIVMLF